MDELDKRFQEAEVRNQQNIKDTVKKAKEEILAAIRGLTTEETSKVNLKLCKVESMQGRITYL